MASTPGLRYKAAGGVGMQEVAMVPSGRRKHEAREGLDRDEFQCVAAVDRMYRKDSLGLEVFDMSIEV